MRAVWLGRLGVAGLISQEELASFLASRGGNSALLAPLVKALDVDGDGHISKAEFLSLAY